MEEVKERGGRREEGRMEGRECRDKGKLTSSQKPPLLWVKRVLMRAFATDGSSRTYWFAIHVPLMPLICGGGTKFQS